MAEVVFEGGVAKVKEPDEGLVNPAVVAQMLAQAQQQPAAAPYDPFNEPPDPEMSRVGKPKAKFRNQGTHHIQASEDPESMIEASTSGDLIRLYELMRDRLVEMLAVCESARDAPALSRAILNVGKEIDSLRSKQEEARLRAELEGGEDLPTTDEMRAMVMNNGA